MSRRGVSTIGCLVVGLVTFGCVPNADLSTTSASPDEYVVSVPGMH